MSENITPEKTADGGLSSTDLLAIFDVLCLYAGAPYGHRRDFVRAIRDGAKEYRIGGKLGFGGKYWPERNEVTCYPEDETPRRTVLIAETNKALHYLANTSVSGPYPPAGQPQQARRGGG